MRVPRPLVASLYALSIAIMGCSGSGRSSETPAPAAATADPTPVPAPAGDRSRSILEDARARGVAFRGTGNEPGWTIEIGGETTVLVTNYGEDRFEFPTPTPTLEKETRRTTYTAKTDGHEIVLAIIERACNDDMSGEPFEATVELELDGRKLRGCGVSLKP